MSAGGLNRAIELLQDGLKAQTHARAHVDAAELIGKHAANSRAAAAIHQKAMDALVTTLRGLGVTSFPEPVPMADPGGVYEKLLVSRVDPDAERGHRGCFHSVLDATHDPAAIPALVAYADAVNETNPELASEPLRFVRDHEGLREVLEERKP